MEFPHFVRIEREEAAGETRHYVVHAHEPRLTMEFTPGPRGSATIKRVVVPNSWAGNYSRYAKVITQAEAFLQAAGDGVGRPDRFQR
jgi:FMN-dependent NADH-azoreductase